jgi:hypothetical protein
LRWGHRTSTRQSGNNINLLYLSYLFARNLQCNSISSNCPNNWTAILRISLGQNKTQACPNHSCL